MIMIGGDAEWATAYANDVYEYAEVCDNCDRYVKGTYEEIESSKDIL